MSFVSELRRRSVFKVGAAYAVVAWLLLQVTDVVLPTFNAPQWVAQTIMFVLAIGFPIAVVLAWALDITPSGIERTSNRKQQEAQPRPAVLGFGYISQGLILVAVGFLVVDQYLSDDLRTASTSSETRSTTAPPEDSRPVRRYELDLGPTSVLGNSQLDAHIALSPDGRRLAYAARVDSRTQLFLRELDSVESRAIAGTEGAYHPFFSPDGESIGFYSDETDSKLKRVSIRGGSPQIIADAVYSAGGSWTTDGSIVFATRDPTGGRSIYRIDAAGGVPEPLLESNVEEGYVTPHVLPGGEAIVFAIRPGAGGGGSAADGNVGLLSLATREMTVLISRAYRPRYSPTGHLLFARDGDLWAIPFDVETLETSGAEMRVVENVQQGGFEGGAAYAVSNDGVLMYLSGGQVSGNVNRNLVWIDRQGNPEVLGYEARQIGHPRLSPDGVELLLTITDTATGPDAWIYDLSRGTVGRRTIRENSNRPLWMPDGQNFVYTSGSAVEGRAILLRPSNGTGQAETLMVAPTGTNVFATSVSPDGADVIYQQCAGGECDIYQLLLAEGGRQVPLLNESYDENDAVLSPDGKWLAYVSNETGREEIYVRPYPDIDAGRWPVSNEGGSEPRWSSDGSELFYRDDESMVAVAVETIPNFELGAPRILFRGDRFAIGTNLQGRPSYDVAPDGQRFLVLQNQLDLERQTDTTRLSVVDNWFVELERLAPIPDQR